MRGQLGVLNKKCEKPLSYEKYYRNTVIPHKKCEKYRYSV
jgi:hypothetical protein